METLFEDVASVMSVMDQYGARDLVNANRVFEELEACHIEGDRVNHVVSILLNDLGIRRRDTNSPDVVIVPDERQDMPNNGALQESVTDNPTPHSSNKAVVVTASVISVIPESSTNAENEIDSHKYVISPNLAKEFEEEMSKSPVNSETEMPVREEPPVAHIPDSSDLIKPNTGAIPKCSSVFRPPARHYTDSSSPDDDISEISFLGNNTIDVIDEDDDSFLPTKRNKISPSSPRKKARLSDPEVHTEEIDQNEVINGAKSLSSKSAEFVSALSDMFPEADPQYLWQKCEKMQSEAELRQQIDEMIGSDYPRINAWKNSKGETQSRVRHVSAAAGSERDLDDFNQPGTSRTADRSVLRPASSITSTSLSEVDSWERKPFPTNAMEKASGATSMGEPSGATALGGPSTSTSMGKPSGATTVGGPSVKAFEKAINGHGIKSDVMDVESDEVAAGAQSIAVKKENLLEYKNKEKSDKPLVIVKSLNELKQKLKSAVEPADDAVAGPSGINIPPPPPREPWQDKLDNFNQILPEADPSYLEEKARELFDKDEASQQFILDALEKKDFPTRKDWQWRQDQLALQKKYTEEFRIADFLDIFPDPFTYFGEGKRQCDKSLGTMFLRNKYRKLKVCDISAVFSSNRFNLTSTCRQLDKWQGPLMKSRRCQVGYDVKKDGEKGVDLQFLQEVAFIENESKIVAYLDEQKRKREEKFENAKANGELLECQCCYDSEVLCEDIRACEEGHVFCVECVRKSSEQRIGEGKTSFPCLADCTAEFKLKTIQEVIKPVAFSRLVQRKQAEEVKAAGIDDLVQCPFCDFCNLLSPADKVFRCFNTDCLKRSCRECKEEDHVPLRCDEVEKSSEVKMRTYIEDQMTAALVRTCWKCSRKFVKEDGCNKMTCQCGALMCYVCRQPVKDYSHFNGQGGDKFDRCPLYSDHRAMEAEEVKKVAAKAKLEALAMKPNAKLKHDPTALLPTYTPKAQQPEYYDESDEDLDEEEEEDDYWERRRRGYGYWHRRRGYGYWNRRRRYDYDDFDEEEAEEEEDEVNDEEDGEDEEDEQE